MNEEQTLPGLLRTNSKSSQRREPASPGSKILEEEIKTTQDAIKQISEQIPLLPKRALLVQQPPPVSLIAGSNNRARSNNETVKRTPPSPYGLAVRESDQLERTKDEVRMKIILENSRLKNSIEALRQDIEYYQGNERKIIEILRESKAKLADYKQKLKDKSRRVSEVTDKNIALKGQLANLESKMANMTSYSEWQERQIQELKANVAAQAAASTDKITRLELLLKAYEQGLANTGSDSQRFIEYINTSPQHVLSSGSISEGTPYSIKEMEAREVESIKYRNFEEEEMRELREDNLHFKARIHELEGEIEQLRSESELRERSVVGGQEEMRRREGSMREEMDNMIERSLSMSQQLSEKASSIENLERELMEIREYIKAAEERYVHAEEGYRTEIYKLNALLEQKNALLVQEGDRCKQMEEFYKKYGEEVKERMEEEDALSRAKIAMCEEEIKRLTQQLEESETEVRRLGALNEELEEFREQNEEKINEASGFIKQRHEYEEICTNLKDSLEYYKKLPDDNLKYFQTQLQEATHRISELEREKLELHDLMEKYAKEVHDLKNDVAELNREKNDSLGSHEGIAEIKEESSEGLPQLESETSLMNPVDVKNSLKKEEEMMSMFHSHPLEEQEQLEEQPAYQDSVRDKDAIIEQLRTELQELRIEFDALREETKQYTAEVVEANVNLDKDREVQQQLKSKLINIQYDIYAKDIEIQEREERVAHSEKIIQEKDGLLSKAETILHQASQENERLKRVIASLEESLQKQRTNYEQLLNEISRVSSAKAEIENRYLRMKQEREMEAVSKSELQNSLQIELTRKRQIENELMNSRRLAETVQSENLSEKAIAEQLAVQLERSRAYQKQLQEKIKSLNSEKNKLHEEVIARMTEKDQFNNQYSHLQSEIEELRHYRRQELEQIEVLKKSTCEIQVAQSSLEVERGELAKKVAAQAEELVSKARSIDSLTQTLTKSNLKIADLQQFQRRTKGEVEQKLAILSNIITDQKNQIQKLNFQKEELLTHKEGHVHSISELKNDKKKLEQFSEGLEKQLHLELRNNADLKGEISKLHDEFDEHMEENNKLKDKVVGCEEEIRRLKLEKDGLHREKELLVKSNDQLKSKLHSNEQMIKDLSVNIAGLKESFELSRSSHDELMTNLKDSIHRSNEESISLKLEQEQSKIGLGNLKQEISQIQIRHKNVVEDYEHRIRSTSVKIEEITQEKEGKIAHLQAALNSLKGELSETNLAKESLQTTVKQLNKVISDNQGLIERLQGQLAEQRDIVSSKDLVISSLQKSIAVKNGEIVEKDKSRLDLEGRLSVLSSEYESQRIQENTLQGKMQELVKQHQLARQKLQSEIVQLGDELQVSRRMLQEAEEDHQLKANKLGKEITGYKMMLEQNQKETSVRLQQSNRSISEIKSELKVYIDTIKQKDAQLKEGREFSNQFKEQLQKLKISSSRFEEEKAQWQQQRSQHHQRQTELQQEASTAKNQASSLRASINQMSSELQRLANDLNTSRASIQQIQITKDTLGKQKILLEGKVQFLLEQKSRIQSKLETIALERTNFQTQCENLEQQNKRLQKRNMDESQEMQISTMNLVEQRKQLEAKNAALILQNQGLRQQVRKIQKEHQTRMENLCLEQRQNLLDVEQKHEEDMQHHLQELQQFRIKIQTLKEKDRSTQEERQELAKRLKANEKLLKDSENQRGELTDKIIQLTQQNNESNAIIQDLRNSVVDKGNQIQQCRQAIAKLQDELEQMRSQRSPINSSGSIPLSIQAEQKLNEAYDIIERMTETNRALERQLSDKIHVERDLNERMEKMKEKETRERHSSCDSYPNRSKIFDEKSQNLVTELEETKIKLSAAEAYIHLLQEENKNPDMPEGEGPPGAEAEAGSLHRRIVELQRQVQNLKMVNEQQEAYIGQLENSSNLASSIRSRRSAIPSEAGKQRQAHSKISYGEEINVNQKVYLLINFIESYARDNKSRGKEEQLKSQLSHPVLQQLLSTIFYRLEKESGVIKDQERIITELHEELESIGEDYHNEKDSNAYLLKKIALLQEIQDKWEKSQKMCEDLLTDKMNLDADVAEARSYIEQLENKLARYEKGREQSKKEGLEILQEQHQSSSDSMMSESADSEIPSVSQSKEFKSSMDIRAKGKLTMSKSIMRTKSNNINDEKGSSAQFLKKCLYSINELEGEVQRIQAELEQKTRMLNSFLGENASKEELINKLSIIESKIKMNDRQIKNHFETSEQEVAAIIKQLLRNRQERDQYGLQNQSRKKIDEYLNLLQQQLLKNSKFYQEQGLKIQETSRRSDSPIRLGGSLHEIKEDAVNQDKGSSIVSPRNAQVLRSFSNSEGVTESLDINEIRHNYNEALRELHEVHDELASKQETMKNIQHKYRLIQQEVFMMLDDIRMGFEQDQYLVDQIEKIKKFMAKYLQEEHQASRMKDSQQKIEEEKANILVQSNQKTINNLSASRKNQNPFQKLLKLNEAKLSELADTISNQSLKEIYRRIQQIINERYDDCLDFLNTEKSLIADILKIRDDEAYLQSTMNKLANKLTKQQITEIITNSHNRMEAHKTLSFILRDDDAKSMVSDEHDFSPNGNKIQEIRNRVYSRPTELSLSIHNQLLEILAAPTRHQFYDLIEQFYKILKDFEDRFQAELSEKDERSQKHSIRIKRVLEGPRQNLEFSRQIVNHLEVKHQKNRSSSYSINVPQNSEDS